MFQNKTLFYLIVLLSSLAILDSCKSRSAVSCPSYWDGDKKQQETRGTNMEKDADGNMVPKDALPTKSPVKKDVSTGLVSKKKDRRMNAGYYRGKKRK